MIPDINVILATATADYEALVQLDTDELYTCLAPNCCSGMDTAEWDKSLKVQWLLRQYLLTGVLPDEALCCPVYCGDLESGTVGSSGEFVDLVVTDDLTVGGDVAVTGGVIAADLTATDDLVVGDDATITGDLVVNGLFTRNSVAQPPYRTGTGTLSAGTLVIAAPWVTANTIFNATYTTASAAAQANISIGTIIPATSFAINGEGTNTFNWFAVVVP